MIIFPLTMAFKRDPRVTVVVSRPGRLFSDNSKYFFIHATEMAEKGERVVFLTADREIQKSIQQAGGASCRHPSWKSMLLLLGCGKVATDSVLFENKPFTRGARLIQLWHGAPLKHIELDTYRKRVAESPFWALPLLKIQKAVIERYPVYDLVLATSRRFVDKAFRRCFRARRFAATGYPRNDILFGWPAPGTRSHRLAWINVDQRAMEEVSAARRKGHRICLYVPTFRKDLANPFDAEIDIGRLSRFAQQSAITIVLKLHPFMHGGYRIDQHPNLIEYAPLGDVYPLMALSDLLVTDYSSIYFDFLLLDRPILFFAYDLEQYVRQDRNIYFDYDTMTPGMKCRTYAALEAGIEAVLARGCRDDFADMRRRVRAYTHDYVDNQSSRRLVGQYLRNMV
jgi:CDP-glycerol glycerophosphotransferase (TagB/SpsB family)